MRSLEQIVKSNEAAARANPPAAIPRPAAIPTHPSAPLPASYNAPVDPGVGLMPTRAVEQP